MFRWRRARRGRACNRIKHGRWNARGARWIGDTTADDFLRWDAHSSAPGCFQCDAVSRFGKNLAADAVPIAKLELDCLRARPGKGDRQRGPGEQPYDFT